MSDEIEDFSYLWADPTGDWVLLRAPDLANGLCVFNRTMMTLKSISSSALNTAICEKMLEAGCTVIEKLPTAMPAVVGPTK